MTKPIHPATVHFPIAFLLLANSLDILNAFRTSLPASLSTQLLASNDMTRASYYLLALGLLTSIPAVVTGGGETIKMIQKQGMYEADGKTIKTKVKATIAHALLNDVQIALATYIWYSKRTAAKNSLASKVGAVTGAAAYAPESWMLGAEVVVTVLMLMGANIGGNLTYRFGVGFSAMNSSAAAGSKKSN